MEEMINESCTQWRVVGTIFQQIHQIFGSTEDLVFGQGEPQYGAVHMMLHRIQGKA